MAEKKFVVEIERAKESRDERKPSVGPVYRNVLAKDGFPPLLQGMETCWDIFRYVNVKPYHPSETYVPLGTTLMKQVDGGNSACNLIGPCKSMSVEKFPNNQMLGYYKIVDGKAGNFVWLTYKDVYGIVMKVGASIRSCGVNKGGRCGIYGANCPEWVISMQACNAHGLYCVPLYDSLGASAVEFIICHAEVSIAFVEEKKIPEVLKTLANTMKYLKTLVSFGNVTTEQQEAAKRFSLVIYSWDEFLLLGATQQCDIPAKRKTDICTIMYTSGTTSEPKGVMISHETIVTVVSGVNYSLESINEELRESDVYLSYLPLAHIFDRVLEELLVSVGASIGYWRGDIKLLSEDIRELKPTIFCAVPRVLDRIYSGLKEKISSGGLVKRALFNIAYSYKLQNMRKGYKHEEAASFFDKIVFSKVKEGLGGNIRLILSGGAPLAPCVETFLRVVTCAHVLQGYGLTESCAASFVAKPNEMSMIGTVGPPAPNVDVCLESVPEMGYDALSSIPRGEICIRGGTLFTGYYKRADLTKEVTVDGWFHTGDIGEWQSDGCMKIIDRKKNIFKLSQGEYVSVENLENIYGLSSEIDAIWIYGNSFKSFLVAVVNPNKQALEFWAEENGVAGNFCSLCQNPEVKAYILGQLNRVAKESKLKGFEFIKALHLDPTPFDMDRDLLTPTFKKKRPQLLNYYKEVIHSLYEGTL